jgi:hypothetical protein
MSWARRWHEEIMRLVRRQGELERQLEGGRAGRVLMLARIFARRLGRSLSDTERAVLFERRYHLGEDRLLDLVLTRDGDALAAWLADPSAR